MNPRPPYECRIFSKSARTSGKPLDKAEREAHLRPRSLRWSANPQCAGNRAQSKATQPANWATSIRSFPLVLLDLSLNHWM
jgi:hypothetical protein